MAHARTGKSIRYLEKWLQFLAISLVKFCSVFNIGQLRICMFLRWRLPFNNDTITNKQQSNRSTFQLLSKDYFAFRIAPTFVIQTFQLPSRLHKCACTRSLQSNLVLFTISFSHIFALLFKESFNFRNLSNTVRN